MNDLDYRVRLSAVKNPSLCDEKTFMRIFESDYNDAVRLEALKRISDGDTLKGAANDLNPLVRFYAYERLGWDFDLKKTDIVYENIDSSSLEEIADENMLYLVAINDSSPSVRRQAFEKITDEHILFDLVMHNRQFAREAFKRISDKNLLLNIALYSSEKSLARKAVKMIDDDEFLLRAVQNNPYNDISPYIVGRFRDESLLEIIALNNSNPFIRKAAVNKIRSSDILIRLGHVECEEVVCTAIVRKCRDNDLLEYIGLSNPCKTVRRYVESVVDDDELLYRFALKEYELDNRRDVISKIRNERYVANLLKREGSESVIKSNFAIADEDLLMDLFENSYSFEAKICALSNMSDKSFLKDWVYASPFVSQKHEKDKVRDEPGRDYGNLMIVFTILNGPYFDDLKCIEEFLIQNNLHMCGELFNLREKITDFSSMYRIALNCRSPHVRRLFTGKLKYDVEYVVDDGEPEGEEREEPALSGLAALFG